MAGWGLATHRGSCLVLVFACVPRCMHLSICVSLTVHLFTFVFHISAHTASGSACRSLFPQVLVTADAPPHAHGGFYFCTCLFFHVVL